MYPRLDHLDNEGQLLGAIYLELHLEEYYDSRMVGS